MRKLFFKSMLLLCALIVGSGVVWAENYVKVTSGSVTSGTYLIVYESGSTIIDGSQTTANNIKSGASVTITNGVIAASEAIDEKAVIIATNANSGYTLQTASGYYFYNTSASSNGFSVSDNVSTADDYTIAFSFDASGNVNITAAGSYLRYNTSSSIFNFYKSTTYTNQKAIQLYKKEEAKVVTSLSITAVPTKTQYEVGESLDMTGFKLDADGTEVTSGYAMKIGETSISNGGTLNNVGKQTISVSYGGKTVYQNISVGAVTKIEITTPPTKTSYDTGDTFDPTGMVVTASLSTGELSEPVTWTKEVTGYTIEPDGALTSSDDFVLIAYAGEDDVQEITVTDISVSSVTLKAYTTIEKTKTETLIPTILPANATNKNVTWVSDNTSVATVSNAGVVTGVAVGTANITATAQDGSGKYGTCIVTVVNQKGTIDYPYSVADVINETASGDDVYVVGYIVGSYNATAPLTGTNREASNLALADNCNESDGSYTIPVQLANKTTPRTDFNVVDHPEYMGVAKVLIRANVATYFSVPGLKETDLINLVAAAVNITSAGWSSAYFDFKVEVPEALTAYYANATTSSSVSLRKVEGNKVLPTEFGVIVNGEEGSYDFKISTADPAINKTEVTNKLGGVVKSTAVASITPDAGNSLYVLGKENGAVGFYLPGDGLTNLAPYKAYLIAPSPQVGAPAIHFIFESENNATSIEEIGSENKAVKFIENGQLYIIRNGVVYDAVGRVIRK